MKVEVRYNNVSAVDAHFNWLRLAVMGRSHPGDQPMRAPALSALVMLISVYSGLKNSVYFLMLIYM